MRLEHYSGRKLKAEILKIIGKYLDLSQHRIFYFGSRVAGNNFERSDIDIGIEGPKEIPGNIMVEIREDIDNLPTLYSFDVVDFGNVSREFRDAAMKDVEYVN
jgi:predicted nucleotidyltransferase